jgi:glycosyltransferase involved in cell wall biosynthesis
MNNLVSIIIPCYNQAQYLPDVLGSVLAQTYPYWECIIVNDGSTDNTEEVAQKWVIKDDRFKYVKKKNGGLSSARNTGLELAVGEYIQLLDADDLLETDKIKCQMSYLAGSEEKIDVVVSGYRYFKHSSKSKDLLIFGPSNFLPEVAIVKDDKNDIIKLFARTNPMVVSAPLYRKSVFLRIGLFDESLSALEDWDFHFRCVSNGIVFQHNGYPPKSKTLIRIHDSSMSANRRNMIANLKKIQQKHKGNDVFALENGLAAMSFGWAVLRFLKMFIPPVFVWMLKKILGIV